MNRPITSVPRILTVGHSNHSIERFSRLLQENAVEVVVDTRSQPYSRHARQFNHEALAALLREAGVRHLYLGNELGGRPEGEEFYDSEGHVRYDRIAGTPNFQAAIARLEKGITEYRVALLCAEEDPTCCHRRLLIGRVLLERGVRVEHIRGDGRIQSEEELAAELGSGTDQMSLFQTAGPGAWRSVSPVPPKKAANA